MSDFTIEVGDGLVTVKLDVADKFSEKDRVALTERLSRPGKPDSDGRLIYEEFVVRLESSVALPASESLKLLEEGLRAMNEADQYNRCTSIVLLFPSTRVKFLPHVAQGLGRFTLPYLKALNFYGDRTHLPLIFSPGTIPSRLRILHLLCELTVCDCAYLLKEFSDTLRVFLVKRLALPDHGTTTTMFPGFHSQFIKGRIRMTTLMSVEIRELFVNPSEMLNKLEMPSLRIFLISGGGEGITKRDFKWIPWSNVWLTNVPDV